MTPGHAFIRQVCMHSSGHDGLSRARTTHSSSMPYPNAPSPAPASTRPNGGSRVSNDAHPLAETTAFLFEMGHPKQPSRVGWLPLEVPQPESVAEHTFRAGIVGRPTASCAPPRAGPSRASNTSQAPPIAEQNRRQMAPVLLSAQWLERALPNTPPGGAGDQPRGRFTRSAALLASRNLVLERPKWEVKVQWQP